MKETAVTDTGRLDTQLSDHSRAGLARPLTLLAGCLLAFYIAFSNTFQELWTYWIEGYNWQFLIPLAFLFMLRERRDILTTLDYRPAVVPGAVLLAGACIVLVAGEVSSTHTLREIALILAIFGMVLLLFGFQTVRRLFWPLAYLILMTAIPTELLSTLRAPLKLLSATMAGDALQAIGLAVYREGTFLYLPHITLEVADSCSGLNQLTSAIALGIPIAYIMFDKLWKRVFIIALSALAAVVMNWVRVFLIGIWHYNSAKESVHGPYGIYELPFIFLIGIGIILMIAMAMADKPLTASDKPVPEGRGILSRAVQTPRFTAAAITGILILGLTGLFIHTWQPTPVPMQAPERFPLALSGYRGEPLKTLEGPFRTGLADDELIVRYQAEGRPAVTLFLAYFHTQNQQRELVDYRYTWMYRGARPVTLAPGMTLMQRPLKDKGGTHTLFFDYEINGRNIVSKLEAKLASLIDAVFYRRNNGAVVTVLVDAPPEKLTERDQAFVRTLVEQVRAALPGQ